MRHRPDPGAQQMRRGMNGAAGQDDLLAAELLRPAGDDSLHADAALTIKDQLRHLRVGRNGQILPHPGGRIQVADRGRHAPFISVRDGEGEITVLPLGVLVPQEAVAGRLERLSHRLRVFRPQVGEVAPDRDPAFGAVPRTIEVHVTFDFLEVGQHAVPVPAGRAPCRPFVIVGRRAAVGQLAVDRRSATQDTRLFVGMQRRPRGIRIVMRRSPRG